MLATQRIQRPAATEIYKNRGFQATYARRTLQVASVILIAASSLEFAPVASAQQRGEDIWGKGNDFSNAQGGVSSSSLPSVPAGKVPKTAAWKAVCNEHFRNIDRDNRSERERIERRSSSTSEREKAWKAYVERRDRQSIACGETWPGKFDLARARSDVEAARGQTGGDAATCVAHAIPVPAPCRDYIVSLRIAKRGPGPYQSRFDAVGNLRTSVDETAAITFIDHGYITVRLGSSMEVLPVCLEMSREALNKGLKPGTVEWRTWADGKVREWYNSMRGSTSSSPYDKNCAFGPRG